ncbi:MAG: DMT family transporter [Deferrisomatales bacterium]
MEDRRAYLFVNAATLLWSGNVVLGRFLRHAVGPWTLAGLRAAVASCLFLWLLRRRRGAGGAAGRREWLLALAMALTGVVGFQVLVYAGLRHTTALNAGIMNATGPLITLWLSRVLLSQGLRPRQVVGALLSLVGVGVVVSGASWEALRTFRFNPGDVLVLAAVLLWGLYSVAGRLALRTQSTLWVAGVSTVAAVPLLAGPAALEWWAAPPSWNLGRVLAVLYIGVGPSFLAFLAWNEGVRRIGPTGAMAFYNTLPLYTGLLGAAALGEWPGAGQILGGALVVAGCLLAAVGPPPRPAA